MIATRFALIDALGVIAPDMAHMSGAPDHER
jgi:hypothetical protein